MAELDAERVGEAVVGGLLPLVIGLDPVARELERVERAAVAGCGRGIELGRGHAQPDLVQIDAVEFPGKLDQRAVAVLAHVGDDGAHRLIDVLGHLALGGEKRGKARGKVRGSAVEAYRHRALSGREQPRFHRSMARAGRRVNPVWMPATASPSRHRTSTYVAGQHSVPQDGPEIGQFGLEALDLEPKRSAAREHQGDDAGGLVGCLEENREQVQNLVLLHAACNCGTCRPTPARTAAPRGGGGIAARCRWPPPSRTG